MSLQKDGDTCRSFSVVQLPNKTGNVPARQRNPFVEPAVLQRVHNTARCGRTELTALLSDNSKVLNE